MYERLRRFEPDFSLRLLRDPSYPSAALREAGLLAAGDPEFD